MDIDERGSSDNLEGNCPPPEDSCSKKIIYLLGNTGSGKTQLIRRTHESLRGRLQIMAIYCQPNSIYDVERLKAAGIPAIIHTETIRTHLNTHQPLKGGGNLLLFYEFSGRTGYSLQKNNDIFRVYVFSVTDGDEKPLKYPRMFKEIELIILNKVDLLPFTDFSITRFKTQLRLVNPTVPIIKLSCRSGVGLDNWRNWLLKLYGERHLEESGSLPRLNNFPGISSF